MKPIWGGYIGRARRRGEIVVIIGDDLIGIRGDLRMRDLRTGKMKGQFSVRGMRECCAWWISH